MLLPGQGGVLSLNVLVAGCQSGVRVSHWHLVKGKKRAKWKRAEAVSMTMSHNDWLQYSHCSVWQCQQCSIHTKHVVHNNYRQKIMKHEHLRLLITKSNHYKTTVSVNNAQDIKTLECTGTDHNWHVLQRTVLYCWLSLVFKLYNISFFDIINVSLCGLSLTKAAFTW